jgi:dTMP kinase
MPDAGLLIALEGIDGSGKSTQAALLADSLRTAGREVVLTREPGGTRLGEGVRALLLTPGGPIGVAAEALLFAAARAELVREVVRPALGRGAVVVCDRFLDSSLAYQGAARGLGVERVLALNEAALDGLRPDLTLLLDIAPDEAAARRPAAGDRIEAEGLALQAAVAEGYRALLGLFPERIVAVPAGDPPGSVHDQVMAAVRARLRAPA